jgi:hypothetical protein
LVVDTGSAVVTQVKLPVALTVWVVHPVPVIALVSFPLVPYVKETVPGPPVVMAAVSVTLAPQVVEVIAVAGAEVAPTFSVVVVEAAPMTTTGSGEVLVR